jgi:hypothetical protein
VTYAWFIAMRPRCEHGLDGSSVCGHRPSPIKPPVAEGEGGGADQRELTHARHFSCLEGLVDQLEATDPIKKPAPSAITTAMTSGFGVATYATARR